MNNKKEDKPNRQVAEQGNSIPKKRKKKGKKRVLLTILMVFLLICLVACLAVGIYVISIAAELPDITAEDLVQAQTSFVYDQMGTEVAALHGAENRVAVSLDEMPDYLIDMVIASEDERFYDHNGVDVKGVIRAVIVNITDSFSSGEVATTQGASTITMQLVRNVIDDWEMTITRKIKEALLAIEFEKKYDKDEILYYYLNEIYLGPNIYGMQAAANYYFNKDVGDITMAEAALLVGLIRSPGYYSPYDNPDRALNIRNTVLNLLAEYDSEKYGVSAIEAKSDALVVYEGDDDSGADYQYPWYVDYVISEASDILEELNMDSSAVYTGGLHIYTALDVNVQRAMEEAYADDDNFPSSSTGDIVESAMAITDPNTGQIKGLVGGRVYETRRGFNRAVDLVRSPGSTIKPIVAYGPAVALGYGSGTVIDDSPTTFGDWSPKNDDWTYKGRITMRQALVESRNICAVKILQMIGEDVGWEYGVKMGLPLVASDANLALALGGLTYGVSPLDMAAAFSTFANEGVFTEPYAITKITDAQGNVIYTAEPELTDVMSDAAAYIVTDMLTDAVRYGTGSAAGISGWQVAGKTGTNGLPDPDEDPDYAGKSGNKDAWFVGYTTALSGAVWMGYDDKKDDDGNLQYLSIYGGSYPARLFQEVMSKALENYENKSFERPASVKSSSVDTKVGGSPTELTPDAYIRSELYEEGYAPFSDGSVEWVSTEVCADTGALASPYCPNKTQGVYLQSTTGATISTSVADYNLYVTSSVCTTHTTPQAGLHAVYVCTDPRHNGEIVLANIPGINGSGGCPEEYREIRYYSSAYTPSTYCALEDHQVTGGQDDSIVDDNTDSDEDLETPYNLSYNVGNGITIYWEDGNDSSTTTYVVERYVDGGERTKNWSNGRSYTDTNVSPGHTYTYSVYAYNQNTNKTSGWSDQVTVSY